MATWVVRQDPIEMTGQVVSVNPPFSVGQPGASPVGLWTFVVTPDPPFASVLTTRNGNANPGGTISCSVGVDDRLVSFAELLPLVSSAYNRRVRIVGTLCDDDDTATTAIHPLGLLVVEYEIEVYDISGWPVAVRDVDLFAFAHAVEGLAALAEPHAGESRTLSVRLAFPFRPSASAQAFARPYSTTRVDLANAATFTTIDTGAATELEATIETGTPAEGKGFFAVQIGLTYDEPDLDNYCPPGTCDLGGRHCAHDGTFRFMRVPPYLPYAQAGDLALSPGDGKGIISGLVASLVPPQVFDHMGIFIDNGSTIRHCTSSQDRIEDEDLFTAEITVKLAGVIDLDSEKVPLNGIRPDLLRFGWPGSITQTVEEVYRTGRNTLNPPWSYAARHPGQDAEDPERPGVPFRIYQLPRTDRQRRIQFNDPERDKGESVVRLQDTPVYLAPLNVGDPPRVFGPTLVRPHPQFEPQVRPALRLVALMARKIRAHYRVFGYSKGQISLDPAFVAPPSGDPSWAALPAGAGWPAGSVPAMCSSFVWTAVQLANQSLPQGMLKIVLDDQVEPPNAVTGLEYGTVDGFYQYHEKNRQAAAKYLWNKIYQKINDRFDSKISAIQYQAVPVLEFYKAATAIAVANQTVNTFAFDACEKLDTAWTSPGEGESASPDNTLYFWGLKPHNGVLAQPEGRQEIYGDSVPILLTAPQWKRIPMFRRQDVDLGTGQVVGIALIARVATAGVTVRFDGGCPVIVTTAGRFILDLGTGRHFAEAFIVLPNPVTGTPETFRTLQPVRFEVQKGQMTSIQLDLEPPSDLWRIVDVHLDADIHCRSFWGGDSDAHHFNDPADDRHFELRQDLEDDPNAPEDQRNTVLQHDEVWRTEPEVGSGMHVAVTITARFEPSDRSVHCHCQIALVDTESGGFLGIGTSYNVDQLETRDVVVPADQSIDVLKDFDFSSGEVVPERARVSLSVTNRRRPS